MQSGLKIFPEESMTDQVILNKLNTLQKTVEEADRRSERVGERIQELKDHIQEKLTPDIVRTETRTVVLMWVAGVAIPLFLGVLILITTQVFSINGRLSAVERDTANALRDISELKLKKAAENPSDPENINAAKLILSSAATDKIQIPSDVLESTGKKFAEAAQNDPAAWDAVLAFVNYRSILNRESNPIKTAQIIKSEDSGDDPQRGLLQYKTKGLVNLGWTTQLVPPEQSFVYQKIDNKYVLKIPGHPYLTVNGNHFQGFADLDGYKLRNVIFRDITIHYEGGPLQLENVYFINCKFEMGHNSSGQLLADAILRKVPVSFEQS